ncbi:MAG: hypothetical protein JXR51_10130 [Bacteroidales bacterium]|nr:hypothetical protein [Bacteroidales bacterium]MBN2757523.1 hypothetical protein [Bacteroidales bacterium]
MKKLKHSKTIIEEILSNGIGWIAGLLSVDLLSHFFAVRSWKNGWGLFSRKTMIDADTFNILEWVLTAILGFIVLVGINRIVKRVIKKKDENNTEKSV